MCLPFGCSATSCKCSLASTGLRHPKAHLTQNRCTCTWVAAKSPYTTAHPNILAYRVTLKRNQATPFSLPLRIERQVSSRLSDGRHGMRESLG